MLHLIEDARLIRVFGRGASEVRRVSEASRAVEDAFYRLERRRALVPPAMEALYGVLFVAVIIGAALGGQNFSLIAALVVLLYRMQPQVRAMQSGMTQLHAISGSLAAVEWLLDPGGKPRQASGSVVPGRLVRSIRFENVTYGYGAGPTRPPVLRDVNCEFRAGRSTALVVRSGAGKSTVVDLLCRLDEPEAGAIWIDDQPLAELDTSAWRARIAVASEQIELVEGSVADNIAYGRPVASREVIMRAAALADAHDFITRLPNGYDTALGPGGALLSSGQGQRIALARALLRDPEVLILDEATNALDGISERAVVEALASRAGRATTIVVSHHRKTLHLCDDVVLLEDGQVRTSVSIHRLAEGEVEDLYRERSETPARRPDGPGRVDGTIDPRDH
jgi:ABC-type multidrug transport system fused ATPase/permease subunit